MATSIERILSEGTVIDGKYEVLSEMGSGSFGRVYRARQLTTGQLVALKVMRFSEGTTGEAARTQVERFQREMNLCAELSHPNLVGLVDSGEWGEGQPYAVFELVAGETLADVLAKEGRLAPREAVRLMGQILDALAAAHRRRIVHRDLKPANIMVGGTGAVRNATLLDLGLGGFVDSRLSEVRRLTGSREFAGTLDYAAPEQLFGATPSERSDLYSWGVVLFECLTGQHPFAVSGDAVASSLLDQRSIRMPEILGRHAIGELLARVTEPDPADRKVDAESLMRELDAIDVRSLELDAGLVQPREGRSTRRQIAVVSCRVEVESADLERSDAALRSLQEICAEAASRYGGSVASQIGERVLLYFGYPVSHENDARRAARAAAQIARAVGSGRTDSGLPPMRVHLGVHAGPVIAREGSESGGSGRADFFGMASAVATQLDELAPAGEVLLSDTAHRLLGPSLETEVFGRRAFRGMAREIDVHRLLPGEAPSAFSRAGQPGFVGRDRPLRQLLESWEAIDAGNAECVVIRGDPGIGKSRLLRETRARLDRARWLECRCLEEWSDTPLRPVADLLRRLDSDPETLLSHAGMELSAAVPLLRDLLAMEPDPAYPRQPLTGEREKAILLMSLLAIVVRLASEESVVLAVEDLHWADPTTSELLDLVVQRIQNEPVLRLLLLLTSRDPTPSGASVIQLAPLSDGEVKRMVKSRLADDEPSPEVMRQVVERSDGVPLFVEEVTRVLVASPGSPDDEARLIPDSLEALLQARLDTLSESTREVMQVAAAIGREYDFDLVRQVTLRSEGSLRRAMDELVRAGVVLPRPSGTGEHYVFRHALIRDAAWNSMVLAARRRCHTRIVERLERSFPAIVESQPELLAHHLGHAGEWARAASMWHQAGRVALGAAAYQEGINRLTKGLDAASRLPDSKEKKQIEARLLETLGMAYYSTLGYGNEKVLETFERIQAICDELGAEVGLQTLYGLWAVQHNRGSVEKTGALVEQFMALRDQADDPLAALYAHGCAGLRAAGLGELALADEQLDLSTRECEAFADSVQLRRLSYGGAVHPPGWWSWVLIMRGQPDRARAVLERMHALAAKLDNAYGYALAGHFAALAAAELEDFEQALVLAKRQIDFSAEQRLLLWQHCSHCVHGFALARSGDPTQGLAEIATSMVVLGGIGMRTASSTFLAYRGEAELLTGNLEKATASVEEGLALADTSLDAYCQAPLLCVRAAIHRAAAEPTEAEAVLRRALAIARAQGAGWFALRAASDLARLLGDSGRSAEGRALVSAELAGIDEGADTRPVRRAQALLETLA